MSIKLPSMYITARRLLTKNWITESNIPLGINQRHFQQHPNVNKFDRRLLTCQDLQTVSSSGLALSMTVIYGITLPLVSTLKRRILMDGYLETLGTLLQLFARNYATKQNVFAYSGDLAMRKPLEPQTVLYSAKGLTDSLQQASESVQRLSTVGYADGRERKAHYVEDIQDRMEDLFGAGAHLELRIAKLTVDIRTVIPHCVKFSQDKKTKAQLVEKIQMRKKLLKYLRQEDYQRFLWLLRELKIRYAPIQEYHGHASKKFLKRSSTVKAAFDVRKQKLFELREQLDAERVDYEVYKQKTLVNIKNDIDKLNLDRELLWKQQVRESVTKAEVNLLKK